MPTRICARYSLHNHCMGLRAWRCSIISTQSTSLKVNVLIFANIHKNDVSKSPDSHSFHLGGICDFRNCRVIRINTICFLSLLPMRWAPLGNHKWVWRRKNKAKLNHQRRHVFFINFWLWLHSRNQQFEVTFNLEVIYIVHWNISQT